MTNTNEEKTLTDNPTQPTFADLCGEELRNPSGVVDSLLGQSHGALPDPAELAAGARVVAELVCQIGSDIAESYALYDPQHVASILGDFAVALTAMADALPELDAAVARMKARGDVPAEAVAAWSAAMSDDILKHGASVLARSARSHAELPYVGYQPVAEADHQAVLIAELERRGIAIDEWAPRQPLPDGDQSVAYIDFAYRGVMCEIRSEEGWEVRIVTDEGDGVVEVGARWGYSPTIHPRWLIDEALAAVDRHLAEGVAGS